MDAAGIKKLFSHGIRRYFARTDTRESWIYIWILIFWISVHMVDSGCDRKRYLFWSIPKTLKPKTLHKMYNFHPVHYLRSPLCNLSLQSLNIIGLIGSQRLKMVMMSFLRWMQPMQVLRLGLQLVHLHPKTVSLSQRLVRLLVEGVVYLPILRLHYHLDICGLVTH